MLSQVPEIFGTEGEKMVTTYEMAYVEVLAILKKYFKLVISLHPIWGTP